MFQIDKRVLFALLTILAAVFAQPGIVRSDGTFSINALGNSSSSVIVPQNLILAKTGTTPVNVINSLNTYNTKLRAAEHLKLYNWEETRYDSTAAVYCTGSTAAAVSNNVTFLVFADKRAFAYDQVYTFNHDTGKVSYVQQLDSNVTSALRTQKLDYFTFNNSHFIARANLESSNGNPSKLFKLNSSNLWTEYQQFPRSINQVADIEYCYPFGAPEPLLLISYSSGLNIQKANISGFFSSSYNLSTVSHGDTLCLQGTNSTFLAALNIAGSQLVGYKYDSAQNAFGDTRNATLTGWSALYGSLAYIKYTDSGLGDIFYISVCQQGTGPSYIVKYAPNQGTCAVLGTIPTPAGGCTDIDTFTIDNTNYMIVSSGTTTTGEFSTQGLYRWNQAVEEWDLISSMSLQQGASTHSVFEDKNSVTWAFSCVNPYSISGSYTWKFF